MESLQCQDRSFPLPSRPPARPRYHHGSLRKALIAAARKILQTQGIEGLSLRAVARRARVSHMAPYHHFADRGALIAAVAEEGFRELRDEMAARVAAHPDDPTRQFQASGVGYVLFAARHPSLFRVMFGAELADRRAHPELQVAAAEAFGVLEQAVAACRAIGRVRSGDPTTLAVSAWSFVHGLAMLIIDHQVGPGTDDPEATERLAYEATQILWEGLRPA